MREALRQFSRLSQRLFHAQIIQPRLNVFKQDLTEIQALYIIFSRRDPYANSDWIEGTAGP